MDENLSSNEDQITESIKKEVLSFLYRGFSSDEIAKEMHTHPGWVRRVIKLIPEVTYFDDWGKTVTFYWHTHDGSNRTVSKSCITREVIVLSKKDEFQVTYFSQTDGGNHMRREAQNSYSEKSTAIEYAKRIKKEYS
ncbi:MAG: hypothetical protein GY839_09975 [candidate division Zixibacteria bacterium]|nr:hypothetical protein [candidate division Zixibacteria bacterium]